MFDQLPIQYNPFKEAFDNGPLDFDVREDGNSPQLTETYEFGQTVSNEDWGRGVGTSRVKKEDLE